MNGKHAIISILLVLLAATALFAGCTGTDTSAGQEGSTDNETITVTDSLGRVLTVPVNPTVVCSGSGTLRYLTYLQAQDRIVGVDDMETRNNTVDQRPYALANPQFKDYPLIGEFRGNDDPEKIVAIGPQLIFKCNPSSTSEVDELQEKTGIPVVAIQYGGLSDTEERDKMYYSLELMGEIMEKEERANQLIEFFDDTIADLEERTADIPEEDLKNAYVGGISYAGAHGYQSTNPTYPPFEFTNIINVAGDLGGNHADVSKESIVDWDPDYLFVDLGTWQLSPSAIDELKTDESFKILTAVQDGNVYGVLPYNYYNTNQGSVLADAYYVGKVVYPDRFTDIDPVEKADEIFEFLVDEPVYEQLNENVGGMGFTKLDVTPES